MTSAPGLRDAFYLQFVAPLLAMAPAWFAYGLALAYADVRGRLDKPRLQEVLLCLEYVFGSKLSPTDRARTARDYYRNRACSRIDAMRLAGNGSGLTCQVSIRGEEYIRGALAEGKGAILCGAHYGSPRSLAGILGARGWPVTMVARWTFGRSASNPLKKQKIHQLVWKPIEHHLQGENITAWERDIASAVKITNVLRRNELVVTNVDARVLGYDRRRAIPIRFMNHQALVLPGPVTISRLTGAPILPTFVHRSSDWRHLEVEVFPEARAGEDDFSQMQTLLTMVERLILREPAQWELWSMRSLVRLGLYPETNAVEFYKSVGKQWGPL